MIPIEKRFNVLCAITRGQHFAWRRAVAELCPGVDPERVVDRMWLEVGRDTAAAYLKRLDPAEPLAPQVAKSIAWSSQCMGEDATVEVADGEGSAKDEAFVRHTDCPWLHWHRRMDLLAEDRPGCDTWFQTMADEITDATGVRLRFETLQALPDGDPCCLRRLWVDE